MTARGKPVFAAAAAAGVGDEAARERREALCRLLAANLRKSGEVLLTWGSLFGPDRVEATTPFGNGSDAMVGLSLATEIAADLTAGAVVLLEQNNLYGAAALVRQLVEIEYITWAFAEAAQEATAWMRSTREDRRRSWEPRHLRDRSNRRFRSRDYSLHCEMAGHPTPGAGMLLRGHTRRIDPSWIWCDLASHGVNVWGYMVRGALKTGVPANMLATVCAPEVAEAIDLWRTTDPMRLLPAMFTAEPSASSQTLA